MGRQGMCIVMWISKMSFDECLWFPGSTSYCSGLGFDLVSDSQSFGLVSVVLMSHVCVCPGSSLVMGDLNPITLWGQKSR